MNMILNPQEMVEKDRCAKDLLVEFNGAAMANQNLTREQARDILEYFRTLKDESQNLKKILNHEKSKNNQCARSSVPVSKRLQY